MTTGSYIHFNRIALSLFLLLVFSIKCSAQNSEVFNLRSHIFELDTFSFLRLDAAFIPNTLQVFSNDSLHRDVTSSFLWNDQVLKIKQNDFLDPSSNYIVIYRVVSPRYLKSYGLLDTSIISPKWNPSLKPESYTGIESNLLLSKSKINYQGAFTRGLAIGNNQDLTLNSAFNLQLAGDLGDNIRIQGAMTDNNIPIQADGNTHQLQEFDKVYVIISDKHSSLTAGDFDLTRPKSFFINYFKKLQGVQVTDERKINDRLSIRSRGGIAITKGKFNRITLQITEGNQGPYRLPGSEGEQFVVVLSGSERVYFNGILLSRGYDRDYIIDYNSGEITFMPAMLITKDARIIVEYEYSNQQYLRSLVNAEVNAGLSNWSFDLNVYSEQDGKNSNRSRELSNADKLILAAAGDSLTNTLVNSIKVIDPGADLSVVSYSLIDTLADGLQYKILVFPWRQGTDRLVAEFADVGVGNYIRQDQGVNGRVFQWVAPDPITGRPRGRYEPLTKLIAPAQQQMFAAAAGWKPDSTTLIRIEGALSNKDINRFSRLNDENNVGSGLMITGEKSNIVLNKKAIWKIKLHGQYEYAQHNFTSINPYRPVEFIRDWNLPVQTLADQHIIKAGLIQTIGKKYQFTYLLSSLRQGGQFNGKKNEITSIYKSLNTELSVYWNTLNSNSILEKTKFNRPGFSFIQTFPKLSKARVGILFNSENNKRRNAQSDTLLNVSYRFEVYKIFLQNNFSEKVITEVSYQLRNDFLPLNNEMQSANNSKELSTKVQWQGNQNNQLSVSITARKFNVKNNKFSEKFKSKDTYIAQAEYLFNWLKRRLNGNTFLEAGSGQEQKFEWNYVKVQPGQGSYAWIDYNQDSIQQINEFIIAPFQDQATYTRITILSNQFIPTLNTAVSQGLRWEPQMSSSATKKFTGFINKFGFQAFYRLDRKIHNRPVKGFWNPFFTDIIDTALVSFIASQRHALFFNRGSEYYELQLQFTKNNSKNILATGFEKRGLQDITFNSRINFGKKLSSYLYLTNKLKSSNSEMFESNNYQIIGYEIRPEMSLLIGDRLRATAGYKWIDQRNQIMEIASAISNNLLLKLEYNRSAVSAISGQFTVVLNRYTGKKNSAVEYAMLEGLKDGRNLVWNINIDQNLKNNIQLNFGYDGRKSEASRTIHTGRASLRAIF